MSKDIRQKERIRNGIKESFQLVSDLGISESGKENTENLRNDSMKEGPSEEKQFIRNVPDLGDVLFVDVSQIRKKPFQRKKKTK